MLYEVPTYLALNLNRSDKQKNKKEKRSVGKIELKNIDCLIEMKSLPDSCIDVIFTDPPYLYLKGQKLEREFDEQLFFLECRRLLKKDGFIVLFGRGTSFYRWNTILADLGFQFKEEIIWNKRMNTLPGIPLQRFHETISIHTIGNGTLTKSRIDYLEKKQFDLRALHNDVKRIASALNSPEIEDLKKYLETGELVYSPKTYNNFFKNGHGERSRATATLKSIKEGMCEGSIIEVLREHYTTIHPTQKPVRLIERVLKLVAKDGDTVLDPFGGSFSTMEAVYNLNLNGISYEYDEEYFNAGKKRIDEIFQQTKLF